MSDSEGVWLKRAVIKLEMKTIITKGMFSKDKEESFVMINLTGAGDSFKQRFSLDSFLDGCELILEIPGILILDKEPGMKALEYLGRDTQTTGTEK